MPSKSCIRLFWAKCNNYGDELSPYIISNISGECVVFRRNLTIKKFMKDLLRFFKSLIFRFKLESQCLMYSFNKPVLLGVGSIINESTSRCIVWGSGIISKDTYVKGGKFLAVRGPRTKQKLIELGFGSPEAIGDPALLLPLIFTPKNKEKEFFIGLIPHVSDFEYIDGKFKNSTLLKIINLRNNDVEDTTEQICSCKYIISSSLHGLIVSHAYNIPSLYFKINNLIGDDIKFIDYFESVNLKPYTPLCLEKFCLEALREVLVEKIFLDHMDSALPDKKIIFDIQSQLLSSFPFRIRKSLKYKS